MSHLDHDPDRDLVPAGHARRDDLDLLVAQLADLPRDAWGGVDVPAIAPPPEIASPPPARVARRAARLRLRLLGGVTAAAAAAVLAVVLVGGPSNDRAPVTAALDAVEPGSGASGRVEASAGRVVVRLDGLAPVRSGAHYEAWSLEDPERPRSLGTVSPDASGAATIDTRLEGAAGEFAVTREPAGDGPGPSGDFVLRGSAS